MQRGRRYETNRQNTQYECGAETQAEYTTEKAIENWNRRVKE